MLKKIKKQKSILWVEISWVEMNEEFVELRCSPLGVCGVEKLNE